MSDFTCSFEIQCFYTSVMQDLLQALLNESTTGTGQIETLPSGPKKPGAAFNILIKFSKLNYGPL